MNNSDNKTSKVQSRRNEAIGIVIGLAIGIGLGSWILSIGLSAENGMMQNQHGCSQGEIGITCIGASAEEQKQACKNMVLGSGVTNSTKVASELCDFSRSTK